MQLYTANPSHVIITPSTTHTTLVDKSHAYTHEAIMAGIELGLDGDGDKGVGIIMGDGEKGHGDGANGENENGVKIKHFTINTPTTPLVNILSEITAAANNQSITNNPKLKSIIDLVGMISHGLQLNLQQSQQFSHHNQVPPPPHPFNLPTFPGIFTITLYGDDELTVEGEQMVRVALQCLPILYLISRSLPLVSLWLAAVLDGI